MAASANLFENFWDQALSTPINYPSDDVRMALLTSSASPNLGTWIHYSDLTNELTTANGYTAGGVALSSKTHVVTVANSWATTWATGAQAYGNIVRPGTGNGFVYMCTTAGTSSGTQPTFPTTFGQSVTDSGGVIWTNIGESVTIWSSAAAQWTATSGNTIAAAYGVIYDNTPATAATKPLIALVNFGATLSATGANLTISPDATYGWFLTSPA